LTGILQIGKGCESIAKLIRFRDFTGWCNFRDIQNVAKNYPLVNYQKKRPKPTWGVSFQLTEKKDISRGFGSVAGLIDPFLTSCKTCFD
jgi:hypothetical protein